MALAKVIDDISESDQPSTSVFDLAASLPPASTCGRSRSVYLTLMESFVLWLASRGSPFSAAAFRAGVAFSLYAVVNCVSIVSILTVFGKIPVAGWFVDHSWSLWAMAALIALVHWPLVQRVKSRANTKRQNSAPSRFFGPGTSSLRLHSLLGTTAAALMSTSAPHL